jgi:hypothetical protein
VHGRGLLFSVHQARQVCLSGLTFEQLFCFEHTLGVDDAPRSPCYHTKVGHQF